MVRVMASGVFDLLHPGHVHYMEEARRLGDELVVVVATDKTARERKHEPINNQEMRLRMVRSLKPVDLAVLGDENDIYKVVLDLKPDIIAIGHDQVHREEKIARDLKERGLDVKVVRLSELNYDMTGTRLLIQKVIDWYLLKRKLDDVEGKNDDDGKEDGR